MCWRCSPCSHLSAPYCWVRSEYPRTTPEPRNFTGTGGKSLRCSHFQESRLRRESRRLFRRCPRRRHGIVVEHGSEPLLRFRHGPTLTPGIILELVALDLADAEIVALGVAEIEPAYRCAGPHREALGELHPDPPLALEQREQGCLFAVVGLRWIAGRGTDAAVALADQLGVAERLLRGIGPELLAHPLVQALGEGFCQPVRQRLDHDGGIIVVGPLEALRHVVLTDARRHHEGTDVVGQSARARGDEV